MGSAESHGPPNQAFPALGSTVQWIIGGAGQMTRRSLARGAGLVFVGAHVVVADLATLVDGDHELVGGGVAGEDEAVVEAVDEGLELLLGEGAVADGQSAVDEAGAVMEVKPPYGAFLAFDDVGLGVRGAE